MLMFLLAGLGGSSAVALSAIHSYPWRQRWAGKVTSFKGITGPVSQWSKLVVEGGEGRSLFTLGSGVFGRLYFPPYSTCWYPERDVPAEEEAGSIWGQGSSVDKGTTQ